jgi:hypothetical protein
VADGGQAPGHDGDGVADLRPDAIDEPAEEEEARGVGELEEGVGQAELRVRPVQLLIEDGLDEREDLPVDVIDGRRYEQQRANEPPIFADRRRGQGAHRPAVFI